MNDHFPGVSQFCSPPRLQPLDSGFFIISTEISDQSEKPRWAWCSKDSCTHSKAEAEGGTFTGGFCMLTSTGTWLSTETLPAVTDTRLSRGVLLRAAIIVTESRGTRAGWRVNPCGRPVRLFQTALIETDEITRFVPG